MIEKDRPVICNKTHLLKMLPKFYQKHLKSQLSLADYIFLNILLHILQSIKKVNLEKLASALPLPIKFESRRKRILHIFIITKPKD